MEKEKQLAELITRIQFDKKRAKEYKSVGNHYDVKIKKNSYGYNKECRFLGFLEPDEYLNDGYPNEDIGYCHNENCNSSTLLKETVLTAVVKCNHLRKRKSTSFTPVESINKSKKTKDSDCFGFLHPDLTIEDLYEDKIVDYQVIPKRKVSESFINLNINPAEELSDKENINDSDNDTSFRLSSDNDDSFVMKSDDMDASKNEDRSMEDSDVEVSKKKEVLSEYERIRLENIKERQKILKEMGYAVQKKKVDKSQQIIKVKINKINRDRVQRKSFPTRRSIRISNGPANFFELPNDYDNEDSASEDEDGQVKKINIKRPNSYGAIKGVPIGEWWATRIECNQAGIHRPTVAGIHPGPKGAYSVVLSGGYDDDVDNGETFTYTGSGGRDLKGTKNNPKNLRTAPQSKDQTLDRNNSSLVYSCDHHKPIRVVRGYKLKSPYAPEEGYRYDGLYEIEKWWLSKGSSGFLTYKFLFKRLDDQDLPPWKSDNVIPEAASTYKEE